MVWKIADTRHSSRAARNLAEHALCKPVANTRHSSRTARHELVVLQKGVIAITRHCTRESRYRRPAVRGTQVAITRHSLRASRECHPLFAVSLVATTRHSPRVSREAQHQPRRLYVATTRHSPRASRIRARFPAPTWGYAEAVPRKTASRRPPDGVSRPFFPRESVRGPCYRSTSETRPLRRVRPDLRTREIPLSPGVTTARHSSRAARRPLENRRLCASRDYATFSVGIKGIRNANGKVTHREHATFVAVIKVLFDH